MKERMNIGEICNRIVVFATEDMSLNIFAEEMQDFVQAIASARKREARTRG